MIEKYHLQYLPLFEQDLHDAYDYVANRLKNPIAALNMVEAVESAILDRSSCAESFEPYGSHRQRRYLYYRIDVGNFSVFYVVIGDIMEVRRFVYGKRNLSKLL